MRAALLTLLLTVSVSAQETSAPGTDPAGPPPLDRADSIAEAVGTPETFVGCFAHWCLADLYRAIVDHDQTPADVGEVAMERATEHEAMGPEREEYERAGFHTGQQVAASLGPYGSCTTTVR